VHAARADGVHRASSGPVTSLDVLA
jgi:hypothetical protein